MASFGTTTDSAFSEVNQILNSIIVSSHMLSKYYWQRQGRTPMTQNELEKHLKENAQT